MPRVKQPHRLFLMETSFQTAQSASFYRSVSCPWKSTKEVPLRILCVYVHVCVCVWFTAPPISTYMHTHTHTLNLKKTATDGAARGPIGLWGHALSPTWLSRQLYICTVS